MAELRRLANRFDPTPTIFGTMSALATRTGAINLGQGFPDEDGPLEVREIARKTLLDGPNQYPPARGVPELRAAVAAHQARRYGITLDPETQVLVTAGATEAIAAAILALVNPGDEVIVFEPYYDSYAASIAMAGGVPRPVTLQAPEFTFDPTHLRQAVTDKTVAILLNTPHNPTGVVFSDAELQAIAELAIEHDLVVISDEVYERLTFDGVVHRPMSTYPGMAERTVTISSVGKSYSLTGWKVGWVTGTPELVATVMTAKQWLTYVSAGPLQSAVAWALENADEYVAELRDELQGKRDLLAGGLGDLGFGVSVPRGTYFVMTDISSLGYDDAMQFCLDLPKRAGVVAIPAEPFYTDTAAGKTLVRWAFCKRTEVLEQALERLAAANLQR